MALDWSKEISFSGLKRSQAKGGSDYPSKVHMNLVTTPQQTIDIRRTAIVGVILLIVVALFIKFGVLDFYARVDAKQRELVTLEQSLQSMEAAVADYDEVLAQYESYESGSLMENGLAVNALDAIKLVDRCVTPYASVASLAIEDSTLTLGLSNTSLDRLGVLVGELERQDFVDSVAVSTASTQGVSGDAVTATVTVQFKSSSTGNTGGVA